VGNTPANPAAHSRPIASSPVTPLPHEGFGTPGDDTSPLSLLGTPASRRSRISPPNSLGRSDPPSNDDDTSGSSDGPRAMIWGTTVDARQFIRASKSFFSGFRDELQDAEDPPYYVQVLEQALTMQEEFVNVDCLHVKNFDPDMYSKLVAFPQETIPMLDISLMQVKEQMFPGQQSLKIQTRPFNLQTENRLRDLDPSDIDKLVSVKGMVTRTSHIIPDLRVAVFECGICGASQDCHVEHHRVVEPDVCVNAACQGKGCMGIVHNRSLFLDKQIIRLQEAPEHMPEGETPQTVSMCTWARMVDVCKPGDRVEITGVYRASAVRSNPRQRTVRAVYKTYVDIVHVRKIDKGKRLLQEAEPTVASAGGERRQDYHEDNELNKVSEERAEQLKELSTRPNIYEELANSLAPSVWELDDIKKGILLQLFGGTHKQIDKEAAGGSSRKRGDINVLLVGDPGTSKSQLLQYVHKVAPRGIYTSGKGSSAVGLTAYVTKDPETKQFVLESGALVLSDQGRTARLPSRLSCNCVRLDMRAPHLFAPSWRCTGRLCHAPRSSTAPAPFADPGVCCIDEFDKMSDAARSILHEAMEQQTVSVAKAGIICSLNARTSVLAAANPINSKYDPKQSVVDNINLPPSLLSRFDLIYLVLDKVNETTDKMLAEHLVSLYRLDRQPAAAPIDQRTLMDYISYARLEIDPKITDESGIALVEAYLAMRNLSDNKKVISATPRQLEGLIRLSEAHARMRLSGFVEPEDVFEADRLMKVSMQSAAMDPITGTIDMDLIATGRSAADRTHAKHLAVALKDRFVSMSAQSIALQELQHTAQEDTGVEVSMTVLREALAILQREGIISLHRNTVGILQ
jgi:DNA replication licensing factor MCM4